MKLIAVMLLSALALCAAQEPGARANRKMMDTGFGGESTVAGELSINRTDADVITCAACFRMSLELSACCRHRSCLHAACNICQDMAHVSHTYIYM
jgi:hypothetical protein